MDFVEGRLRGRAIAEPERVAEETERIRGAPLPALDRLREAEDPIAAVRELSRAMARSAWGLEAPPTTDDARADARAYQAVARTLDELETFARRDGSPLGPEAVVAALERTTVRPVAASEARTRRRSRLPPGPYAGLRRRDPARPRGGHVPEA